FNLRQDRCISGANLRNQCYRDYMYGKDGQQERNLARLEDVFSQVLRFISSSETLPPPFSMHHEAICILILVQSARTAYSSDMVNELADKMWKTIFARDSRIPAGALD